jgi:hypothetical protein
MNDMTNFNPVTNEDFEFYKNLALRIYNEDIAGKANPIAKNCVLNIDNFDFVNSTYGDYIYPNTINIYLCSIIQMAHMMVTEENLYDTIVSCLIYVIFHEASHSDQKIEMKYYLSDKSYYKLIEGINDTKTILYLTAHREEFETKYNFSFNFMLIEVPGMVANMVGTSEEQRSYMLEEIQKAYFYKDDLDLYTWTLSNLTFDLDVLLTDFSNHTDISVVIIDHTDNTMYTCPIKAENVYKPVYDFIYLITNTIKKYDRVAFNYAKNVKDGVFLVIIQIMSKEYKMNRLGR